MSSTSFNESEKLVKWQAPNFDDACRSVCDTPEKSVDQIMNEAYAAGFEMGRREGIDSARKDTADVVQRFVQVANSLEVSQEDFDRELSNELAELAAKLARHIVGRELVTSPDLIVGMVERIVESLPYGEQKLCIHLHPDDATALNDHLAAGEAKQWRIREDVTLARGDCRVEGQDSLIECKIGDQLDRIIENCIQ